MRIKDYLPTKVNTVLIQARVSQELVEKVRQFMFKNNLSWSDLVTACFKKLVAETEKEEKR